MNGGTILPLLKVLMFLTFKPLWKLFTVLHQKYFHKKNISENPKKWEFDIIVEENEDLIYFTIWNKRLKDFLVENISIFTNFDNHFAESKISFRISLMDTIEELKDAVLEAVPVKKEEAISTELKVYTFVDESDLEMLTELNNELSSILINMNNVGFNEENTTETYLLFSKYAFILNQYKKIKNIGLALYDIAELLNNHRDSMLEADVASVKLFEALVDDLYKWLQALFVEGAPSVDFLDDSIIADTQIIKNMILTSNDEETNTDDIFDF